MILLRVGPRNAKIMGHITGLQTADSREILSHLVKNYHIAMICAVTETTTGQDRSENEEKGGGHPAQLAGRGSIELGKIHRVGDI